MMKRTLVSVMVFAMFTTLSKANEPVTTSLAPSGTAHHNGGSVAYDGEWYLWSGYSLYEGNHRTEKLEIYDPLTDSWSYGADCPFERNGLTAFELNGKMYSIGGEGYYSASFNNDAYRYDPAADSWETLSNFPTDCWRRYGAVAAGTAYVFGGHGDYGPTQSSMWKYDEAADSWSSCASMPISTLGGVTAVVDEKIYVIGGNHKDSVSNNTPTSEVQVYDPQLDQWAVVGNCPIDLYDGAGIVHDGSIFFTQHLDTETLWEFDTATLSWSSYDFTWPEDYNGRNALVVIDDGVYIAADDRVHSSAYRISSVPEPSTVALLVMGIAGLLVTRFRKRK